MLSHHFLFRPIRVLTRSLGLSLIPILLLSGCERPADSGEVSGNKSTAETALEHAAKHLDSTYVCPMHPDVVRDEPASCPICGMDLVAREARQGRRRAAGGHAGPRRDPEHGRAHRQGREGHAVEVHPHPGQGRLRRRPDHSGPPAHPGLDREPLRAHGRRAGRAQGRSRRLRVPRRAPGPAGLHLRARGRGAGFLRRSFRRQRPAREFRRADRNRPAAPAQGAGHGHHGSRAQHGAEVDHPDHARPRAASSSSTTCARGCSSRPWTTCSPSST